jgi:hypothetical protein
MAAGLGFKTFTTGEVLTAADVNGYLMQGILVFATEAARNSAITSPQEGQFAFTKDTNSLWYYTGSAWVASGATGDIEGVTAGVGISGGGTSGTVTITNDMATTITASGDIVVGTGSGTYDNLPIGSTGQVLTADTTVSPYKVKWAAAGGASALTKITSATFSSVASVSFPANTFTTTYDDYQIIFIITNITQNTTIKGRFRASGTDNTSNNYFSQLTQAGTSATDTNVIAGDAFTFGTTIANGDYNHGVYTISEPKRSQKTRLFGGGVALDNTTNSNLNSTAGSHFFNDTTSFDSFTIIANSGNITGRYAVYGLEK